MLQLVRVRYGRPIATAPISKGNKLSAGMAPTDAVPTPSKTKPMPTEGDEYDGMELLDDGVVYVRPDAVQTLSEKRFDKHVCSEIMLNSGDMLLVKQLISEVMRMITMAC